MKITLRSMVTRKFLKMKKINTTNINTFSGEMYLLCKQYIQWSNIKEIMRTALYKIYKSTKECTYNSKYSKDNNEKLRATSSENYHSFTLSWVNTFYDSHLETQLRMQDGQ